MSYWLIFSISVALSAGLTGVVRLIALHFSIVDDPNRSPGRKYQRQAIPLLGGLALYSSFVAMMVWLLPDLTQGYLLNKHVFGMIAAGGVIVLGGIWDDVANLSAKRQVIFPLIAAGIIVAVGIGISYISNPFGGVINLAQWQWTVFWYNDLPYQITLWADLFVVVWLLGTTYTTKLLDGLDGLVAGVLAIGALIIFFLSISPTVAQPETGVVALVVAGVGLGFLFWNFAPAKIYLGESGALLCGFWLGVLAIISGGKIATALLILGLPIIDVIWVIVRRSLIEKRSPFSGDTSHLHFQLLEMGLSNRTIAILYYLITLVFGVITLLASGLLKIIALVLLTIIAIGLIGAAYRHSRRHV
ncbi:MAG: hypothetical protein ACD_43C00052G0005 [uncultured bacterium]|nr:MAG: hypothetical protein ACD_43C00052G0005 [uncultured bacterium]